ncbi:MAG: TonB-dependent receptor [SAR86 cluster bacterium]|jgi:iron complex outermembrane receptor protein|uniref:TonB-dependent receptor n=1 Tax=SAR86 cluster bacterium TaxID=2030880 RepID=A0A520N5N4_9GAMM|nr:MAG: TonB-dependent receptor [SAR86 cluster bacterium]
MNKFAFTLSFIFLMSANLFSQQTVEEVIVTATKTEKTLQEIPVAVSVVTADTIEKANITDIYDLRSIVPSLDSRRFTTSTEATYVIRGFGNGSFNPGIEPSVAVFIDGVYRSSMQAQIADLPAIERIEVLRGPQSTLFGKNATAGVINVVTKKPSFDESGYASASVGSNNMKKFKYYKTGPLDESKAYSFYANIHKADGHSDNMTTGNTSNNRDRFSVRGEMLFDLANEASLRVTVDYDEYDEICCAVGSANYGSANQVAALLGGGVIPNDPFTEQVFFDFDPVTEGDNSGITLHYSKEADGTTLESITSIRNSFNTNVQDVDFDAPSIVNPSPQTKELDAVTQEFRLYSNDNEKFNWLIGGYYYQEDLNWDESIYFGPLWRTYIEAFLPPGTISQIAAAFGIPDAVLFASGQGGTETATQDNTTTSIFAQVDIQLTEKLSAIVGASYMEDEKTVSYSQTNTDVLSNLDFVGAGTLGLIAAGFPPAQAAVLATDPAFNSLINLQFLQLLPQFTNFPNAAQDGKSSDDNVDYTFKLSYELSDTVSVYGGISTGFKASAWNISRNSDADAAEVAALAAAGTPASPSRSVGRRYAGPEEAEVTELGAKILLPSGYLNIALFDQTIDGFQSNTFIGTGFVLVNAGSQSADGYEFDLVYSPLENIDLMMSGVFLDPVYDSFPVSAFGDLSGTTPSNIPEETITTSLTWNWDMNGWDGYTRISHLYSSEAILLENPQAQAIIDSQGNGYRKMDTINFSTGIEKDNLSIRLYGQNVNDDEYLTSAFVAVTDFTSTTYFGYPNNYATYGLTVNYTF